MAAPISGPIARSRGTGRTSTTVTSRPRWRALAATSSPMNPAPITTTRSASAEVVAEGEGVVDGAEIVDAGTRRRAGKDAGVSAPVATTSRSKGTSLPSARRTRLRSRSRPVAAMPSRHSASRPASTGKATSSGTGLAGQDLLRQRRPVVGRVALGPDDGDRAIVAASAQRLGRPQAGQGRSHHHGAALHGRRRYRRRRQPVALPAATGPSPGRRGLRRRAVTRLSPRHRSLARPARPPSRASRAPGRGRQLPLELPPLEPRAVPPWTG